ncbi:MAG: hypothetical protein OER86_00830 [Phycisphaerae bacterium]|nr:hypothetical protein [Phycisphaerae bacterium]
MTKEKSNLKAGVFVLAGITLTFAVIILLSDIQRLWQPMQSIGARFPLSEGLGGLQEGAVVTVGGQSVSTVQRIQDVIDGSGIIVAKDVYFELPAGYMLYENANIELDVPLVGSGTKLNVRSFGTDLRKTDGFRGKTWRYESGDPPIAAGIASSSVTLDAVKNLGVEDLQRQQIRNIIGNVDQITSNLQAITGEVAQDPRTIPEILADVHTITDRLAKDVPRISEDVTAVTKRSREIVDDFGARYQKLADGADQLLASLQGTATKLDEAVVDARKILEENRPIIARTVQDAEKTVANAREVSDRIKGESMKQVHAALEQARTAMAEVRTGATDLKAMIRGQRPVVERTLANLRLTSDQLKLAAVEVRRAPWRLLYEPSDQELESENLYDAARSFALAAGSLNMASDTLRAILDGHAGPAGTNSKEMESMVRKLSETFDRFESAEQKFWQALGKKN